MINPPVIKRMTSVRWIGPFFKLEHLLPLRLGLNVQNLVPPKVGFGDLAEKHPTTLRFGGSYFIDKLHLFDMGRVTLVSDLEWMFDDAGKLFSWDRSGQRGVRWYTGLEVEGRINDLSLMLPRIGYNSADGPSRWGYGFGLKWTLENWTVQADFAHGLHPELANDPRFSLTITYGGKRDARYFAANGQTATSLSDRDAMLHVVSGYPADWDAVREAALLLADTLDNQDSVKIQRYYDLIGGPLRARFLAAKAIADFQRGQRASAREHATSASADFGRFYEASPRLMRDDDYLLYGQCEMIKAATDGAEAESHWLHAAEILGRSSRASLKRHFLVGACRQMLGQFDSAAGQFDAALRTGDEDAQSMRTLARLWLGHALLQIGRPDSAIATLTVLTDDHALPAPLLDENYPRYWTFGDKRVLDDAQLMVAQSYLKLNDETRAAAEFVKVCRFYPGSDKCLEAQNAANQLIEKLLNKTR